MATCESSPRGASLLLRTLLPALVLALGAGGCSSRECQTSRDCTGGLRCDRTGRCVGEEPSPAGCGTCSGATPVCDEAAKKCVACTALGGCGEGGVCDTSVAGGRCVRCLGGADCGASAPVCDAATKTCVTCTATEGCTGGVCDTSRPGGACVGCLKSSDCRAPTPVCDADRRCVACTATEGCAEGQTCNTDVAGGLCSSGCDADDDCSDATPVCDAAHGACVVCTATGGCPAPLVCDTSTALGACVRCLSSSDCPGAAPVCSAGECVACTATEGCSGQTPRCDVAGGRCVQCLAHGDCAGASPRCDTATSRCVQCLADADCPGASPRCDAANNRCVQCFADADCGGAARRCDVLQNRCIQCLSDADCDPATPVCEAGACVPGTSPGDGSRHLAAARATPDGAGLNVRVENVLVTFLKPPMPGEGPGFFVQADRAGPGLYVTVDPATLAPPAAAGDRVSFTIAEMGTNDGMRVARAVANWTRVSSGHAVAPLATDITRASDVVSGLDGYESRLVRLTGTVATAFSNGGAGHVKASVVTEGMPAVDPGFALRLPASLPPQLDLGVGCRFTLDAGPMWRYTGGTPLKTIAEPSAYSAADLALHACPAPRVVGAHATTDSTVIVSFDRVLDPASVLFDGSQFVLTPGLPVYSASAAGKEVLLATASQGSGLYTVAVAASVRDTLGAAVDPAQDRATFAAFASACRPQVVISQVYGGGGNSGAPWTNDFVELHNRDVAPANLNGWSVQYTSATGTGPWNTWNLAGTIAPGGFFLLQCASGGANGSPLPTPDQAGCTLNLSGTQGKVALVRTSTALVGCPGSGDLVDLVGYGPTANCFEGAPTAALGNTTAAMRPGDSCGDTGQNTADFAVAAPNPHTSASAAAACTCR